MNPIEKLRQMLIPSGTGPVPSHWYHEDCNRTEKQIRDFQRALDLTPVVLRKGDRMRTVSMRGCMADVRHNPQDGVVERIYLRRANDRHLRNTWMAKVRMDNGDEFEFPASSNFWIYYEGVAEYRM